MRATIQGLAVGIARRLAQVGIAPAMLQATRRLLPAKIPAGRRPLSAVTSLSFVGTLNRFCGTLSVRRYARRGRTRPKMRPRKSKSAVRPAALCAGSAGVRCASAARTRRRYIRSLAPPPRRSPRRLFSRFLTSSCGGPCGETPRARLRTRGRHPEPPSVSWWSWATWFSPVFGLNLLPAFGPPTWAVLVLFRLHSNLAATASGRSCKARAPRSRARPVLEHRPPVLYYPMKGAGGSRHSGVSRRAPLTTRGWLRLVRISP